MNTHEPGLPPLEAPNAGPTVLATGAETGGVFALVSLTLPPYDAGPPLHCHPQQSEGCYVVAGTLALACNDSTTVLTAGSAALVPAGTPHTCWNPTAAPATVLLIYRPGVIETEALAFATGIPCGRDEV
jgi:uncharacterized cupin superfamily protein